MKGSQEITPLRTILENCLNHIENLESNRGTNDEYEKEFCELKQFSESLKTNRDFLCSEGEKEVNRKKNRYKDILPFNVSRVVLASYPGIPGSDYINANFIKGASGSPAYIASQGPLAGTVNDFWRMVVECEVQVIVMACNAEEAGKHKCENYWVEKEGEEKKFGMVEICLVKASTVCPDFLVRTMRVKYTNVKDVKEERTVCQFHYSAWPDHGVPPLVRPLLEMVRLVRDTQASETLPVLVHCSAGCGRTGTICAIDFVWGLLRAGKLTEDFSLFNLVRDMRKQRVAMVQTKEQYILVHQAVRELFREQLRVIDSHPYENIDLNGVPIIKDIEEPLYDTILYSKDTLQEKQDLIKFEKREKLTEIAPPLPTKKRPNIPTKQEKEVENLTEKNRSLITREKCSPDVSPSNSLLSKPRIAKLKALFERSPNGRDKNTKQKTSQTVARSHSLGAMRKPLFTELQSEMKEEYTREELVRKKERAKEELVRREERAKEELIRREERAKEELVRREERAKEEFVRREERAKEEFVRREERAKEEIVRREGRVRGEERLCNQPIPGAGKLIIPKLPVPAAPVKPATQVKRSKSLKATNQPSAFLSVALSKFSAEKPASAVKVQVVKPISVNVDTRQRRRSLESLIGDEPPVITWPTTVHILPKPSHSLKHQFHILTVEAQKKVNLLVAGLGVRERRNSFRRAISREEAAAVHQPYEPVWVDNTINVENLPTNLNDKLIVRTQNGEILKPIATDCVDGVRSRNHTTLQRSKTQVIRRSEDLKPLDSRNRFLQRLNSEMIEDKKQKPIEMDKKKTSNFLGIRSYKPPAEPARLDTNNFFKQTQKKIERLRDKNVKGRRMEIDYEKRDHCPWIPPPVSEDLRSIPAVPASQAFTGTYKTGYNLYATVGSKANGGRVVTSRPTLESTFKTVKYPSGTNSLSSHSSSDLSELPCNSPTLDQRDSPKKQDDHIGQRKWPPERSSFGPGSESSSSSGARELHAVLSSNPADRKFNYGVVSPSGTPRGTQPKVQDGGTLSPNRLEPVPPSRVKRLSAPLPGRRSMIETNGQTPYTAWPSPSKREEELAWNENLGVDLDKIAASIQSQKGISGLSSDAVSPLSTTNCQPHIVSSKKQHYL